MSNKASPPTKKKKEKLYLVAKSSGPLLERLSLNSLG